MFSQAHKKLLYTDNLNINNIKVWNTWFSYTMEINKAQPMQLRNKTDLRQLRG